MESTALVSQAIMEACIKLDIDPVTYLVKNAMKKGDRYHNANAEPHPWQYNKTATGAIWLSRQQMHSIGLTDSRAGAFLPGYLLTERR